VLTGRSGNHHGEQSRCFADHGDEVAADGHRDGREGASILSEFAAIRVPSRSIRSRELCSGRLAEPGLLCMIWSTTSSVAVVVTRSVVFIPLRSHPDVWVTTSDDIADHFQACPSAE
jgi:hypothetical protein